MNSVHRHIKTPPTHAHGEGNGTPLQCSCLENPRDQGAWWAAVHGVAESQTPLSDFTFPFHFHALEKAMATHSSTILWRIPGTGEPGGLPSTGSHRVWDDWSDLAAAAAYTHTHTHTHLQTGQRKTKSHKRWIPRFTPIYIIIKTAKKKENLKNT